MKKPIQRTVLVLAVLSMPVTFYSLADYIGSYGIIGSPNTITGSNGMNLAVGYNNLLSYSSYSAVIGWGLQNSSNYSTVLGLNNQAVGSSLFLIGNGADAYSRRNAFEVLNNGAVKIPLVPYDSGSKVTIGTAALPAGTTSVKVYGIADIDQVPAKGGISMGAYSAP